MDQVRYAKHVTMPLKPSKISRTKMPIGPTNTKAEKRSVVKSEMHKFGKGDLHSGSKHGPVVTNPKQAIAISLSESGQSKPKGYARSAHHAEHFKDHNK